MAFKKKTWADRMVEYAGRRKLTNISTKQSIICDVERSEGTISKEGDAFSSQNMNDLEQRIEDGFTEVKQTTDGINQNLTQGKYFKELALESGTVTFQDSNIRGNASVIRYGRLAILTLAISYATDLSPGVDYFFGASSILPVASIMITGNTTLGIAYNGYITTEGIVVIRFATNIFKASDEIHFSVPFYS